MTPKQLQLELERALLELVEICETELRHHCRLEKSQTLDDIKRLRAELARIARAS